MSEKKALKAAVEELSLEEAVGVVEYRQMVLEGDSILAGKVLRYKELGAEIKKILNACPD